MTTHLDSEPVQKQTENIEQEKIPQLIWKNKVLQLHYYHHLWILTHIQRRQIVTVWTNIQIVEILHEIIHSHKDAQERQIKITIANQMHLMLIQTSTYHLGFIEMNQEKITFIVKDRTKTIIRPVTTDTRVRIMNIDKIYQAVLKANPKLNAQLLLMQESQEDYWELKQKYQNQCLEETQIITSTIGHFNKPNRTGIDANDQENINMYLQKIRQDIFNLNSEKKHDS